jgi:hypothetical protein
MKRHPAFYQRNGLGSINISIMNSWMFTEKFLAIQCNIPGGLTG